MEKRWEIVEPLDIVGQKIAEAISLEMKCPFFIAELLYRKGFTTLTEINEFFYPKLDMLHNPFLFSDMKKSVLRILKAIEQEEKITIFGDYDVDGTTATALLVLGLSELGAIIDYYIPHRLHDGYGLTLSGLETIKENGTSLIISVDCGIFAIDEVEVVRSMGMEIIITDHHIPKEKIPQAFAIMNPNTISCSYPYKDLAGVGVAYKLLMAIYQEKSIYTEANKTKYRDLVAVGTIADIVSLSGENRILAIFGLHYLRQSTNKGLKALMNISRIRKSDLDENGIVYGLAPRINAAGRMGSARRAVDLLISNDDKRCFDLVQEIENENQLRQQLDQKVFLEAEEIIKKKYNKLEDMQCIVIVSDNWLPGVIGIVASKIAEKYHRPTILISLNEGIGRGSGRSIASFDLYAALFDSVDLMENFGGHKYAVGLTILPEYIKELEDRLISYIKTHFEFLNTQPPLYIQTKIELYEINFEFMNWINRFAPFGINNQIPIFYTEKVRVDGYPFVVGKNHLKLKISKDGVTSDLIGFNFADYSTLLKTNSLLDIAYTLELSNWKNKKTIQGILKDIKII